MSAAVSAAVSRRTSFNRTTTTSPMPPDIEPPTTDPASDPRRMRRIFAEDPDWNMAAVPSLVQLCFDHLVNNYDQKPVLTDMTNEDFKDRLIDSLGTDLPLQVVCGIEKESYWKRKVESVSRKWAAAVTNHGNSWKRLFFEKHVQKLLEQCRPETESDQMDEVLAACRMGAGHIRKICISQLLPPEQAEPEEPKTLAALDDDDEDIGDDMPEDDDVDHTDHIDVTPVLRNVDGLEELRLTYVVKDCGMNFTWAMFGMTSGDCSTLGRSLRDYAKISTLAINQSLVDDHKTRILCSYLLKHKTIKCLDLAHNAIEDSGARALAKLVNNSSLEELNVCDNKIQAKGGKALGKSLQGNTNLRVLNLRLNRLGESGGKLFFQGILGNRTLKNLNISSNSLGQRSASALCEYVDHNPALAHLDLTCNVMGVEAGALLLEALDGNTVLQSCDMRLTKFDTDTEFQINVILKSNSKAAAAT